MPAPTVIRWDTPGAPVLMRKASAIIDILNFCLPQRGWTKDTGIDKAVYRTPTGSRKYYRVLNDGSFYYGSTAFQYTGAMVNAYDSMSDIDTGLGMTGSAYLGANKSTDKTSAHPWVVIFDETGFYFISFPHLTAGSFTQATALGLLQYFGETIPALPDNTPRNVLAGGNTAMVPHYPSSIMTIGYAENTFVNRSLDGTRTNIKSKLQNNGGEPCPTVDGYPYGNSVRSPYAYPYNGALLYSRPMLDDALDYTMGDYIPGLYCPCHPAHTLNSFQTYAVDGKVFIAFRVSAGDITTAQGAALPNINVGACLIDISESFRP